ncbi:hypothetical protein [Paragemmobacter aquarius]|uniref:hypothetical protein n=1 Tax=Paragemmobacter aquarius TaxID=2169400 RepID=UPI00131F2ACD|nr:hypothetical protein [Gemmobacter aquarius]
MSVYLLLMDRPTLSDFPTLNTPELNVNRHVPLPQRQRTARTGNSADREPLDVLIPAESQENMQRNLLTDFVFWNTS